MAKIYQIGSGMIGSTMALDLSKKHEVHLGDINTHQNKDILKKNKSIKLYEVDASNYKSIADFIQPADIVLLAVPGHLGFSALKTIIECGKDVVDISFSSEDFLSLDSLAKQNKSTVIVDAGVAPGIPNFLLGYYDNKIKIDSFSYYVGGLPKYPKKPFNYKAPFSPIDVIEEYTRPARMMIGGSESVKSALSDVETISFKEVGNLEAFNTDGLRSILSTMKHIPNMKEKTIRYPGHALLMKKYRDEGAFSSERIKKTSDELFNAWKLDDNEEEFTIMKIIMTNKNQKVEYVLYDEYDKVTSQTSMSRSTGYTATASVNLILNKLFTNKGVYPPELVGKVDNCTEYILNYLKNRNISLYKNYINL